MVSAKSRSERHNVFRTQAIVLVDRMYMTPLFSSSLGGGIGDSLFSAAIASYCFRGVACGLFSTRFCATPDATTAAYMVLRS